MICRVLGFLLNITIALNVSHCTKRDQTEEVPEGQQQSKPTGNDRTSAKDQKSVNSADQAVGSKTTEEKKSTGSIAAENKVVHANAQDVSSSTPVNKINAPAESESKINADRDSKSPDVSNLNPSRPAYKPLSQGYNLAVVQQFSAAHQAARGPGYKYVYMPFEIATSDREMANILRVAMAKTWNHLSWQDQIDIPEDASDGAGLVFALNINKLWGAAAVANWGYVAACTPKSNISISPAPRGQCTAFDANQPVAIPRFVFNATQGGPYANIHKTPTYFGGFRQKFRMGPIQYTSTHKEAIVCGPRITSYRMVTYNGRQLLYSYTSDEFDGRDNGNIKYLNAPTDRDQRSTGALRAGPNDSNTAIASEWWMQLPNGFMYWGIHGEGSQERGKAETPFAIDPANWRQGHALAVARSCMTCHALGVQLAKSDEQFAGKNGWTSNEQLDVFYQGVRDKFQNAMRVIIGALSDAEGDLNGRILSGTVEPVAKAIMLIEGRFTGGSSCSYFCNGKYGPRRQNLCSTLPAR